MFFTALALLTLPSMPEMFLEICDHNFRRVDNEMFHEGVNGVIETLEQQKNETSERISFEKCV
jgi:hypothetical protein